MHLEEKNIIFSTITVDFVKRPAVQRDPLELIRPRRGSEARERQCGGQHARREELVLQQLVHGRPPRGVRLKLQHYHRSRRLAQR